jgi:hypothetical protein
VAADKHGGLDIIVEAAKKDPRYSKMKGGDDEPDTDEDQDEGGLDDVFSAKQAAAIKAYVESCKA